MKNYIDRIAFYPMSYDIADNATYEQIDNDPHVVMSSPLANIQYWGDKIYFQDRIAIELFDGYVHKGNIFFDYDFWSSKKRKKVVLKCAYIQNDGTAIIPKTKSGIQLGATIEAFLSYERKGSKGDSYIIEVSKSELPTTEL